MIRYLSWILLLGMIFAVEVKGKKKTKFTITGIVLNKDGEGLKKVKLSLINEDGKKVGKDKTGGNGEFKFKKIPAGSYILKGIHKKEGEAEINFTVTTKDVDLTLKIPPGEIQLTLTLGERTFESHFVKLIIPALVLGIADSTSLGFSSLGPPSGS